MLSAQSIGLASAVFLALGVRPNLAAETNLPPADFWLPDSVPHSAPYDFAAATTNGFDTLRAAVLSGRLKVLMAEGAANTNTPPTLVFSIEAPGHWPSRDWVTQPMRLLNGHWECAVPVEDPEVPIVYFLRWARGADHAQSPLRICVPRLAGLETPTQLFWSFLDGFEVGASQWWLVAGPGEPTHVEVSDRARTGRGALRIELPTSGRSRTVATTRVRGRVLEQHGATGIRLWMRSGRGSLEARFTLIANAGSATQVVSPSSRSIELNQSWQAVDVPLSAFAKLPIGRVDRFAIECVSETANECLVDDVQLLGPWSPEGL